MNRIGREAVQAAAARAELSRLTEHVAQRLRLLALDRSLRGNLGWPQDRFVGRETELGLLRSRLLGRAPAAPRSRPPPWSASAASARPPWPSPSPSARPPPSLAAWQ